MEQKELHEEKIVANATIAEETKPAAEKISVEGMTDEIVEVPPKVIILIEEAADSKAELRGPRSHAMCSQAAQNLLVKTDQEGPLEGNSFSKPGEDPEEVDREVPGTSRRLLKAEKRKFPSGATRNEATKVSNPPHSFVEIDLTETDDEDESEGPSRAVVNSRQTGFGNDEVEEDTIVKEQRGVSGCRCKYVVKHIQGKCTTPKPPVVPKYKRPRRRL